MEWNGTVDEDIIDDFPLRYHTDILEYWIVMFVGFRLFNVKRYLF